MLGNKLKGVTGFNILIGAKSGTASGGRESVHT